MHMCMCDVGMCVCVHVCDADGHAKVRGQPRVWGPHLPPCLAQSLFGHGVTPG